MDKGKQVDRDGMQGKAVPPHGGASSRFKADEGEGEISGETFTLEVIQQPYHGCMATSVDKADRHPIDPVPILLVTSSSRNCFELANSPNLVVKVTAVDGLVGQVVERAPQMVHTTEDDATGSQKADLMRLPVKLRSMLARGAAWVGFDGLSFTKEGKHTLCFTLLQRQQDQLREVAKVLSSEIRIYSHAEYPGPLTITPLTILCDIRHPKHGKTKSVPPPQLTQRQPIPVAGTPALPPPAGTLARSASLSAIRSSSARARTNSMPATAGYGSSAASLPRGQQARKKVMPASISVKPPAPLVASPLAEPSGRPRLPPLPVVHPYYRPLLPADADGDDLWNSLSVSKAPPGQSRMSFIPGAAIIRLPSQTGQVIAAHKQLKPMTGPEMRMTGTTLDAERGELDLVLTPIQASKILKEEKDHFRRRLHYSKEINGALDTWDRLVAALPVT